MTAPHDPYRHPDDDPRHSDNVYGSPQSGPPQQPGWGQHPQQPYGQQPAYGQPQPPPYGAGIGPGGYGAPPPKKSSAGKTALIIIGAIVGLCLVLGIFGSVLSDDSGTDTASAPTDSSAAQPAEEGKPQESKKDAPKQDDKAAGLNQPVRDGKFEFTVKSVQCGKTKVGTEYLNDTAQGQFCLVNVAVKNIGDEAQSLASSAQKAYNAAGQEFSPDDAASLYVNEDQQVLYNEINPGNSVNATLVWDIPKGQKLTKLELHDSVFSGGVEVNLG